MGDPLLFVLCASSACSLLVMWGSRSETMWRAGPSRRNCGKSCGKLKAAYRAVLPSLRNSLGSVKLCEPGQAARGIRSLLEASGHLPATPLQGPRRGSWRIPWRILVACSLWAPALLLQKLPMGPGAGRLGTALAGGFRAAQLSVSRAGSKGCLCSVPSHSASR